MPVALETSQMHVTPFRLFNHGASGASSFTSGGTDLGEVLSIAPVGYDTVMEQITRQTSGPHLWDGRLLATNVTLEVVLGQRTSDVLKLMHRHHWASGNSGLLLGVPQVKPGHLVKTGGYTTRLQVAAMNDAGSARITTRPHLYLPNAFCIAVGPHQFARGGRFLEAAVMTIVAYWNDTLGANAYEGDPATFPSLT